MDGRRWQRWDNHRRSQHRKPPRSFWQPTVPAWEKEFCKVVGSLDWGTFLRMKKFMHLYSNVIKWNDSAGEEAFSNAKRRFWAEKNGFPCDVSSPDPDLYIDKIDWDSEIDAELLPDLESTPMSPNTEEDHGPVVIFGDSLMPDQAFMPAGWGDVDENLEVQATYSSANYGDQWGNSFNNWAATAWPGYSKDAWQGCSNDAWQGCSNDAWQGCSNDIWQGCPNAAWQGYSNNACQFGHGNGPGYPTWGGHCSNNALQFGHGSGQFSHGTGPAYPTWGGGWNNNWNWSYANNYFNNVDPDMRNARAEEEQRLWNHSNVTTTNAHGYVSSYRTSRVQANEERRNHVSRNAEGRRQLPYSRRQSATDRRSTSREWNAITVPVGQTLDQK